MDKIVTIEGQCIPLPMNDVDTDLIIPAQYLTSISDKGYGEHLFQRLRDGDENFAFNQPKYQHASILLAGNNFGCGSSREHAVWALTQAGIKAVIAESFADIFTNNSGKNGLLLVELDKSIIEKMIQDATESNLQITIEVENLSVTYANKQYDFELDPFLQYCYLNGLDELDYLLANEKEIKQFKQHQISYLTVRGDV